MNWLSAPDNYPNQLNQTVSPSISSRDSTLTKENPYRTHEKAKEAARTLFFIFLFLITVDFRGQFMYTSTNPTRP